jgi:hypothetical protein
VAQRDVFISYSQPDHDAAHELVSRVEARGVECWVAPRNVEPGEDFAAAIVNAIANARVMVLMFSASANSSPHVRREVERAVSRGVPILPFRVANIVPSAALEYFLAGNQWLDAFPPPMEPHYTRLCACLSSILATPPNPPLQSASPGPSSAPRPTPQPVPVPLPPRVKDILSERVRPPVPLNEAELQLIERDLATYIGPIARQVVFRAVDDVSSIDALLAKLGAHIESEPERRRFINNSREKLRGHNQLGRS